MTEALLYHYLLVGMVALSVVTFVALFVITAPYGRHTRAGWGPMVSSTVCWLLMEAPASLGFLAFYLLGEHRAEAAPIALLCLWQLHYANARFVSHFAAYPEGWLTSPRFLIGVAMFLGGFAVNWHADEVLRTLRAPGERGYKIPHGGLYRFVSAPNYFGELVEWSGFAIAAWSPAALAFVVWTAANLAPRAWANHRWYQRTFPDYPTGRRALVPFIF
jgi:3-oxo-5-alpha-steroid 4-dehydrogenase 1